MYTHIWSFIYIRERVKTNTTVTIRTVAIPLVAVITELVKVIMVNYAADTHIASMYMYVNTRLR